MARFVTLTTSDGKPTLVNVEAISCIQTQAIRTRIYFTGQSDDYIEVTEPYEAVENMLSKF